VLLELNLGHALGDPVEELEAVWSRSFIVIASQHQEVGVQLVHQLAELEVVPLVGELEHVGGQVGQRLHLHGVGDRYRDHRRIIVITIWR
jgi:hypothetical protein